jgi:cell wall-associated NlpC family hydrolase
MRFMRPGSVGAGGTRGPRLLGPAGAPGHVGMAIGAGLVVDAPHTGAGVQLTNLSGWLPRAVAIRRIVPGVRYVGWAG